MALSWSGAGRAAKSVEFASDELSVATIPQKRPDQRWVWVHDFRNGLYSKAKLLDVDSGEVLGQLDTGWEGIKLDIPASGDVMYHAPMYMSRGFRGERTDVIEYINKRTLEIENEVQIPAKAIRGWPDPNHSTLSDDGRFLFLQFFTPASSIGVVDLKAEKYLGEIETAGCAHVMAAGNARFFTLCGDGSVLSVILDGDGKEVSRKRFSKFFDPDKDPLHGSGMRAGNIWYFVSWNGVVHPIDVGATDFLPLEPWKVAREVKGRPWVTGTMQQPLWVNDGRKLYVSMQPKDGAVKGGGTDYHRQPGVEVWVYDIASRKRERRIKLAKDAPAYVIATSAGEKPLLYVSSLFSPDLHVYSTTSGKLMKRLRIGQTPTLIQPVK